MAGRPPDPRKRERILAAAIAVFLEDGSHGATTVAIARRAGMSSSHMYVYFRDKGHLLVEAVCRMKDEHAALSTELAAKGAGLDDAAFIEAFYAAQATIRHRVRFIASCVLSPRLTPLFDGIDFDYSSVFMPFLKEWPQELAAHTARALMAISLGYFLMGDMEGAKAASMSVLGNARRRLLKGA